MEYWLRYLLEGEIGYGSIRRYNGMVEIMYWFLNKSPRCNVI